MTITTDCKVSTEEFIEKFDNRELVGVLVEVSYPCSSFYIANDLIKNGVSFVFLSGDFSTNQKLNSIVHHSDTIKNPVFEVDNVRDKAFLVEIKKMGPNNQMDIEFISNTVKKDNFKIDFYYSPTTQTVHKVVHLFQKLKDLFGEQMNLQIHASLYSNLRNPESMHCVGSGKYCAPITRYTGGDTPTGRIIIKEMLRERCIFMLYPE